MRAGVVVVDVGPRPDSSTKAYARSGGVRQGSAGWQPERGADFCQGRLGRACPAAGQARKNKHAAPAACTVVICHACLELEGPADPRVSLLVDSPWRSRGLMDRAVLHGLHHLFVLRRGRLRCRRLGFDDLACAQDQSHGQDQPCGRQPAVSASSQAYGSHCPSPVRFRRGRPDDADLYSNFRARHIREVVTLGFLDPIGRQMVACGSTSAATGDAHVHRPPPRGFSPVMPNLTGTSADALSSARISSCRVRAFCPVLEEA